MAQKTYNTESLRDRGHGNGPEDGGLGEAGLYRHPESGEEMHTLSDPLFGEAQSNAAVRLGFVRVRDSRPDEIHNIAFDSVTKQQGETDSLKGLSARVNQLEGVQERNKVLEAQLEEMRKANQSAAPTDSGAVAQSVEDAKTAAKNQVQDRGQGNTRGVVVPKASDAPAGPRVEMGDDLPEDSAKHLHPDSPRLDGSEGGEGSDGDEGDEGDEKPLAKQNETEVKATAAREGVDLTGAESVKAKREAVQAHRDLAAKLKEESENE